MNAREAKALRETNDAHRRGVIELLIENERLKALIKKAEFAGEHSHGDGPVCPWCRSFERDKHGSSGAPCPAFTPAGDVK